MRFIFKKDANPDDKHLLPNYKYYSSGTDSPLSRGLSVVTDAKRGTPSAILKHDAYGSA